MSKVSVQLEVHQYVWVDVEDVNDTETIKQEALNIALENPFDFEAKIITTDCPWFLS